MSLQESSNLQDNAIVDVIDKANMVDLTRNFKQRDDISALGNQW